MSGGAGGKHWVSGCAGGKQCVSGGAGGRLLVSGGTGQQNLLWCFFPARFHSWFLHSCFHRYPLISVVDDRKKSCMSKHLP